MKFNDLPDEKLNIVIFNQLKKVRFFITSRNIKISKNIKNENYINKENYRLLEIEIFNHFNKSYRKIKTIKSEEG